jgi:N-acetylglucosamine malate deacetylase 1
MAVDLLVFGPHPDDLEIGLGGTIARHVAAGSTVGLCDMTAGEMGSNGTVDERLAEAEAARKVLGAAFRENLRLPDRGIGKSPDHLIQLTSFIRRHRPRVVAAPYWSDRHPDHVAASALITEAVFNAGLRKYRAEGSGLRAEDEAHKAEWICYYFINDSEKPSFVVDVSDFYEKKRQSLDCHVTQFQSPGPSGSGTAKTRLNTPVFRQLIESRDAQFGALAGVTWAEGFVVRDTVARSSLFKTP